MINGDAMTSSDESRLSPARYRLGGAQLAAGFSALGLTPPTGSLYGDLPAPAAAVDGSLLADDGTLAPAPAAMLRVLADAQQAIALDSYSPHDGQQVSAAIASAAGGPPYVMQRRAQEDFDLALLTTRDQLLAVVDELAALSYGPSGEGLSLTLSLPAMAALTAMADVMQDQTLRSQLARAAALPAVAHDPLDLNSLAEAMENGLERPDLRWTVSLMAFLSDFELAQFRGNDALAAGIKALGDAGLIDDAGHPTGLGIGWALALARPLTASRFLVMSAHGGNLGLTRLIFLRGAEALLCGVWQEGEAGPEVLLAETSATHALKVLGEVLKETAVEAAPAHCRHCRAALRLGARFCQSCGAVLGAG